MSTCGKSDSLFLVVGPTAVGKTRLLFNLFKENSEIISADSMQIYRFMDIGTAKPSLEERALLPHHLIDILNPEEQFHAGQFVSLVDQAILGIRDRGNFPIISGGSAYYLRNYIFGLPTVPPTDYTVIRRLEKKMKEEGRDSLLCLLNQKDPISATRIHPNDTYRLLRALQVLESTGAPLSSFEVPKKCRLDFNLKIVGLNRPREELYDRINLRVDLMFQSGLIDEIQKLKRMGYDSETLGMKGIGYREFFDAEKNGKKDDFEWISNRIKKNSRKYAKKQLTFFKLIPNIEWFHPDDEIKIKKWLF